MLRSRTLAVASVIAGLSAAAVSATADGATQPAGTARVEGGAVVYEAASGAANRLTIAAVSESTSTFEITDPAGNVVAVGDECRMLFATSGPKVRCTAPIADPDIDVTLGDGDDEATFFLRSNTDLDVAAGTGADAVKNVGGRAVLDGGSGDDRLESSAGPAAHLFGRAGKDLLLGTQSADQIEGGTHQDTIDGRDGKDVIRGGFNADKIEAADGEADTIDCGNELTDATDTANIDEALDRAPNGELVEDSNNDGCELET